MVEGGFTLITESEYICLIRLIECLTIKLYLTQLLGSEKRSPDLGWDLEMLACDWLKQARSHLKSGFQIGTPRQKYALLFPRP